MLITNSFNPLINSIFLLKNLFYFSCLFCVIAFVFFIYAKRIGIDEIINCIYQRNNAYQILAFIAMSMLLIIINLVILMMLCIFAYSSNQLSLYISIVADYYCMNVFLPLFVSFIITFIFSCFENYRLSAILLTVTLILTSPLMEFLEFRFPLILALDKIPYYIHLPFAYFTQNIGRGFDTLYGFQNEIYKLSIAVFWCLTAVFVFTRKKLFKRIVLVILCISFVSIYIPQSIGREDKTSFGTYADYNYYDVLGGKANYLPSKTNNYHISDYSLHIKINRQLNVSGDIVIQSDELRNDFVLTLYHGYKVKDIKGENLKSFEISGDTIELKFNKQTKKETVTISYAGYNQNLYSNYQAAMLPGYFPWYPMAGIKQVYVSLPSLQDGYNPFNRITKAKFEVYMDEVYFPFVLNLQEKSKGVYTGESDSLTLIGGNIIVQDNNQFMNYLPLEQILSDNSHNQKVAVIKQSIKNIFQYDAKFLDDKVIVCSTSLSNGNQYNGYSEFQDYIINPGNSITEQDILDYYIIKSSLNIILKNALMQLDGIDNTKTMNGYMNELLLSIDDNIRISKSRENKKEYSEGLQLRNNIDEFIDKYGVEAYLTGLGRKIFDEEKTYENFY